MFFPRFPRGLTSLELWKAGLSSLVPRPAAPPRGRANNVLRCRTFADTSPRIRRVGVRPADAPGVGSAPCTSAWSAQ